MGHFTIFLPEEKKADVRWGMVHKMQFPLFRKNKSESKIGYVVHVTGEGIKTEYRLFKSPNGEWFKDPEAKIELNDSMLISIKNAIIEKELSGQ